MDVRGGDGQAVQGEAVLLREFHQPGRHPVQFLAGVGQGHRLPHVLQMTPHLKVDHLGAAADFLKPEIFPGRRSFQTRDQHPGGEFDLALLEGGREISREFPRAQPAFFPHEIGINAGRPAAPGHQRRIPLAGP